MKKIKLALIILVTAAALTALAITLGHEKTFEEQYSNETVLITQYAIYGTHLYFHAETDVEFANTPTLAMVSVNSEGDFSITEKELECSTENGKTFLKCGKYINSGIDLESIAPGSYALFIKCLQNKKSPIYYALSDTSGYSEMQYYSLSLDQSSCLITVDSAKSNPVNNNLKTLTLKCEECALPENVYDIVIEVGHGGNDPGATGYLDGELIKESDLNLTMALYTKQLLEEKGFKVALTRADDTNTPSYGTLSRSGTCNTLKAKLNISLHNNSNYTAYRGTEIFLPANCDAAFAKLLADKIAASGCGYSTNTHYKIADGVYQRLHTASDVYEEILLAQEGGFTPYEALIEGTNYYFMLREIGGISTGAYVDGRNPLYEANPYIASNNTAEAYIVEMGYMNDEDNLRDLVDNYPAYCEALAEAVDEFY